MTRLGDILLAAGIGAMVGVLMWVAIGLIIMLSEFFNPTILVGFVVAGAIAFTTIEIATNNLSE